MSGLFFLFYHQGVKLSWIASKKFRNMVLATLLHGGAMLTDCQLIYGMVKPQPTAVPINSHLELLNPGCSDYHPGIHSYYTDSYYMVLAILLHGGVMLTDCQLIYGMVKPQPTSTFVLLGHPRVPVLLTPV